jgi:VWFA-related protein
MVRPGWQFLALILAPALVLAVLEAQQSGGTGPEPQKPVFRTGVDLVHVTATVTDSRGHFVAGLGKDDFNVTEDGQVQTIVQFSAERAPVSIGFALDTSSSMAGAKLREAKEALLRVMGELLQADDEVFLYTFSESPVLQQRWTTDRRRLREALDDVSAHGRTALYDTVREALLLLQSGKYRKKVLLVVSDGNDTASFTPLASLREQIQHSEAMVYAIAIASDEERLRGPWRDPAPDAPSSMALQIRPPQRPPNFPPRPGGGGRPPWAPPPPPVPPRQGGVPGDWVNVQALKELTDISGGRTEVVRTSSDLGPATASVADELSRQYQLMYQATTRRDGRWHAITVTVRDASYQVRARRGYVATGTTN